jgi:hypothetical protein
MSEMMKEWEMRMQNSMSIMEQYKNNSQGIRQ